MQDSSIFLTNVYYADGMYKDNVFLRKITVNLEFDLVNDRPEQLFGTSCANSCLKGM